MGVVGVSRRINEPLGELARLLVHLDGLVIEGIIRVLILNVAQSLPILKLNSEPLKSIFRDFGRILVSPLRLLFFLLFLYRELYITLGFKHHTILLIHASVHDAHFLFLTIFFLL